MKGVEMPALKPPESRAASSPAAALDTQDRLLLNILQSRFPLAEEPFRAVGEELGASQEETVERIARLRRRNVIRQVSAIFDTRRLGYRTSLVAMSLSPERLHKGARVISRHPGVSHNYAREGHPYNLWFTLAVPPRESLEDTVQEMARRAGATGYRLLPTIRFFKIGVNFDMVNGEGAAYSYHPDNGNWNRVEPVTEFEVKAIRELQEDLPLEPRPFDGMAQRLGISVQELFGLARSLQERGVMRRYSAVLHHRRAGFKFNAMTVWRVPPGRGEEVGAVLASSPWVTHC
ncbi:MAG: AsnC family transcriptional regulator, partial [Chloroflexi bacterium]|nr:AsnC family transcriptional regulator [Chloroflexota bacterium]